MAEATECPSPCGGPGDPGHVPDAKPLTLQQMIDLREIENVPPPVRLPKSEAFARGECGQLAGRLLSDTCDCGHLVGAHRSAGPDGPLCQFCEQEAADQKRFIATATGADVPSNDPASWARTLRAVADKLAATPDQVQEAADRALATYPGGRRMGPLVGSAALEAERLEKGQPEAVIMRARDLLRTTAMSYQQAMALAVDENLVRVRLTKPTTVRSLVESHRATAEATADQVSDLIEELETAVPVDALREEARRQLLEARGRDKLMAYGNRAETTWRRSYPVLAALADRGEE